MCYSAYVRLMQTHLPGKHGLVADPNDDFNCEKPVTRHKMQKRIKQMNEVRACVVHIAFITFSIEWVRESCELCVIFESRQSVDGGRYGVPLSMDLWKCFDLLNQVNGLSDKCVLFTGKDEIIISAANQQYNWIKVPSLPPQQQLTYVYNANKCSCSTLHAAQSLRILSLRIFGTQKDTRRTMKRQMGCGV